MTSTELDTEVLEVVEVGVMEAVEEADIWEDEVVEMGLRMVAEAGPMLTRILSLNIISFGKCCYRSLTDSLTKYLLPHSF